jgi:hypothetical protein
MTEEGSKKTWFFNLRKRTAWVVLFAVISLLVSHYCIEKSYPTTIAYSGGPRAVEWMYYWRAISLIITFLLSLLTIPRWQSIIGIIGTLWVFFSLVPM